MNEDGVAGAKRIVAAAQGHDALVAMAQAAIAIELDLLRSTPRLRQLLKSASFIADDMNHTHVGAEHLMLAILADPQSIPCQILDKFCKLSELVDALEARMSAPGYASSGSTLPMVPEEPTPIQQN